MAYAIEASGLKKSFRGKEAVGNISLNVKKGELFALLGPNGAGKTTTIHMLSTLLKPDGGTALVAGYDVVEEPDKVRGAISLTGQYAALDEGLSGRQNLEMIARLYGYSRKEAGFIAEENLEAFGLLEAKERAVAGYSGGMRRRLDIAASIVARPELIFLDEPTTGLDPQSRIQVWEIVRKLLQEGTTVVLTTQYLEEADQLADRVAVIDEGALIAEGTPAELKASLGGKTLSVRLSKPAGEGIMERLAAEHSLNTQSESNPLNLQAAVQDAAAANAVIQAMLDEGMAVEFFSLREPSLDEVFLALTDGSKRRARA